MNFVKMNQRFKNLKFNVEFNNINSTEDCKKFMSKFQTYLKDVPISESFLDCEEIKDCEFKICDSIYDSEKSTVELSIFVKNNNITIDAFLAIKTYLSNAVDFVNE